MKWFLLLAMLLLAGCSRLPFTSVQQHSDRPHSFSQTLSVESVAEDSDRVTLTLGTKTFDCIGSGPSLSCGPIYVHMPKGSASNFYFGQKFLITVEAR